MESKSNNKNKRRNNRIAAVQLLFMEEANPSDSPALMASTLRRFFEEQEHPREYYEFTEELVSGTLANLEAIDNLIKTYTKNWAFNRIAKTDLAILRLAIYELLYRSDIPPIVSINEAIDLTKVFSQDDAKRFINGILDKVKEGLNRPLRKATDDIE